MQFNNPASTKEMKTKHMTTLSIRNSINRWPLLSFLLALASFVPLQGAQALRPPPDGGHFGANTAEGGGGVLFSLTNGTNNTALGSNALHSLTTGDQNTATGAEALFNSTASFDTANGFQALHHNLTGFNNTATGWRALFENTIGFQNTAIGAGALFENSTGIDNTAVGAAALNQNETGRFNTAIGFQSIPQNTTGDFNTAAGNDSLFNNTSGKHNTAIGVSALHQNTTGDQNIALGVGAGALLTTGDKNIDIGSGGAPGESSTIRIGDRGIQLDTYIAGIFGSNIDGLPVVVDGNGHLGVGSTSSARFKDAIKPMDKASEAILALKPVTFYYKKEIDPKRTAQFGLVAEEVEKINPDLVTCDTKGELYTVRYEAVNAMLLNEFLKDHRKMQEQEAAISQLNSTVAKQDATIAQQQKGMEAVAARLNEQAAQIQKVTAQLEASKPAPQVVNNP
jgi:uncharacterized coiled-coil protein SlyX